MAVRRKRRTKSKPKPERDTVMLRVAREFADYLTDRAQRQGITRCTLTRQLAATLTQLHREIIQ